MLTDCLAWRELKLVHNFACHDRRIRGSARRRLRNSVIVSQLGSDVLPGVERMGGYEHDGKPAAGRAGRVARLGEPAAITDSRRDSGAPLAITVDSRARGKGGPAVLRTAPGWRSMA